MQIPLPRVEESSPYHEGNIASLETEGSCRTNVSKWIVVATGNVSQLAGILSLAMMLDAVTKKQNLLTDSEENTSPPPATQNEEYSFSNYIKCIFSTHTLVHHFCEVHHFQGTLGRLASQQQPKTHCKLWATQRFSFTKCPITVHLESSKLHLGLSHFICLELRYQVNSARPSGASLAPSVCFPSLRQLRFRGT